MPSDKYALMSSQGGDLPVRLRQSTVQAAEAAIQLQQQQAAKPAFKASAPVGDPSFDWTVVMAKAVHDGAVDRIGGPAQYAPR